MSLFPARRELKLTQMYIAWVTYRVIRRLLLVHHFRNEYYAHPADSPTMFSESGVTHPRTQHLKIPNYQGLYCKEVFTSSYLSYIKILRRVVEYVVM